MRNTWLGKTKIERSDEAMPKIITPNGTLVNVPLDKALTFLSCIRNYPADYRGYRVEGVPGKYLKLNSKKGRGK